MKCTERSNYHRREPPLAHYIDDNRALLCDYNRLRAYLDRQGRIHSLAGYCFNTTKRSPRHGFFVLFLLLALLAWFISFYKVRERRIVICDKELVFTGVPLVMRVCIPTCLVNWTGPDHSDYALYGSSIKRTSRSFSDSAGQSRVTHTET